MSYTVLQQISPATPDSTDPAHCCVGYKYGWKCGGNAAGPGSDKCNNYMAQRCAKKWDNLCELYSLDHGGGGFESVDTSTADVFNRTSVRNKFCKTRECNSCKKVCQPFMPEDPDSPEVCEYIGECTHDCSNIDEENIEDRSIHKCLQDPSGCKQILGELCEGVKKNGVDASGTALGEYCNGELAKSKSLADKRVSESYHEDKTPTKSFSLCSQDYLIIAALLFVLLIIFTLLC